MFNKNLNQPLGHYVWEVVFGMFNSFFQKCIHPWDIFIAECYIYIGYRATKLQKKFVRLYYMQLLSNLTIHLFLIVFFIS